MVRFYSFFSGAMYTGVLSHDEFKRAQSFPMEVGGDWEPTYELELPPVKESQHPLTLRVDSDGMEVGADTHTGWMAEFYEEEFVDEPEACVGQLLIQPWNGNVPRPEIEAHPEDVDVFREAVKEEFEDFEGQFEEIKAEAEDDNETLQQE